MATFSQNASTAIELQDHLGEQRHLKYAEVPVITLTTRPDDVMEASLIADSEVPDGGRGWVVILGCAVVTWWFIGTSYCWGVLQAELVKEGLSTASTLSFVGSLAIACVSFLGIVNARLIRIMGTRLAGLCGISLLGLGEILSGFAIHSVGGLFATAGVVMGVGIRSSTFLVVYDRGPN